jgi:hypothetical protein
VPVVCLHTMPYRSELSSRFFLIPFSVLSALKEAPSGWHLWRSVRAAIMPFLKCSALFFHYLNGVPAPPDLQGNFPFLPSVVNACGHLLPLFRVDMRLGVMVYACNRRAGRQGQLSLHRKFQDSHCYTEKHCLKNNNSNNNK